MALTPAQIEDAFEAALGTISGLRARDDRPSRALPLDAWPELVGDAGRITFGDDAVYRYDVYLLVPAQASRQKARAILRPYLARDGAQSVYAAVHASQSLSAMLLNWTLQQHPLIDVDDVQRYGAVWRAEVMAS